MENKNLGFWHKFPYKYSQVYFRNCGFGFYGPSERSILPTISSGFYVIDSCNLYTLPIANVSGNITVTSSLMNFLTVNNTVNLRLTFANDSAISFAVLKDNKNMEFQLNQCAFKDSGELRIFNSTFSQFDFSPSKQSSCNVYFENDTINTFIGGLFPYDSSEIKYFKKSYKHKNIFTFYNCYINTSFIFYENIPNSTFIFNKCSFGPDVYLADMAIDKLVIRNCQNVPQQMAIGFSENSGPVKLELVNSSIDNMRFDFTSNMELVFDSIDTKDVITNSYKNLMEKFEHEGKERSYEFVDLQYRNFKDNRIFHFLNCIWWYHGYMSGLVFAWAIAFLLIFFYINLIYWDEMFEAYPIKEGQNEIDDYQRNKKLRFYSIVFLYTFFIFFSLRINLDKLNFKRLKFVYIFLLQYLTGLWCTLFIIRFIFKI